MLPTREKAEELLRDAEKCNPGPWGNHSRVAAHCAIRPIGTLSQNHFHMEEL